MTSSLVSCDWLNDKIQSGDLGNLILLDVSWTSKDDVNDYETYKEKHIPGARYLNVLDAEHTEYLIRNIPTAEHFTELTRKVGVNKSSHVVVYSSSMLSGFFMSGRAWWTFRIFGFENVSILNGGLARWEKLGYKLTSEVPDITPGDFEAASSKSLYKEYDDVVKNIQTKSFQVVDTRAPDLYNASQIPGAFNLCAPNLIDADENILKPEEELKTAFSTAGVDLSKPVVSHCKGGMSSTTIAFVAQYLGQKNVAVYHGGFTDWAKRQESQTS